MKSLLFLLFLAQSSFATTTNYKPVSIPIIQSDELVIKGFVGDILLKKGPADSQLVLNVSLDTPKDAPDFAKSYFDNWIFSYKKEDGKVVIQVRGPQTKQDWSRLTSTKNAIPSYNLSIISPDLPTKIDWFRGKIKIENWEKPVSLNVQNGSVAIEGLKADLNAYIKEGHFSLFKSEGSFDIEAYNAKVTVKQIKGELALENFTGSSQVEGVDGPIKLTTFKGKSTLSANSGNIEFDNGQAALVVQNHNGGFRGNSGQGPVSATLSGNVNVRIKSKQGPVSLRLPGSGAWVNIGTAKGQLIAPNFLKLNRWPNIKTMTGRLRGGASGSVFVRSESGNIRIR